MSGTALTSCWYCKNGQPFSFKQQPRSHTITWVDAMASWGRPPVFSPLAAKAARNPFTSCVGQRPAGQGNQASQEDPEEGSQNAAEENCQTAPTRAPLPRPGRSAAEPLTLDPLDLRPRTQTAADLFSSTTRSTIITNYGFIITRRRQDDSSVSGSIITSRLR